VKPGYRLKREYTNSETPSVAAEVAAEGDYLAATGLDRQESALDTVLAEAATAR
jgi:hypothetical protein